MLLAGDAQDPFRKVFVGRGDDLGPQFPGEGQILGELFAGSSRERDGTLDMERDPGGIHRVSGAPRPTDQGDRPRTGSDGDHEPLARFPCPRDPACSHDLPQLVIHAFRGQAKRHFAKRREVAFAEEMLGRLPRALRRIDLPLLQALEQLVGRNIHQFDLGGGIKDRIGDRLADDGPGDLCHRVGPTLQVLNIQRCVHIDPVVQQLQDILVAFRVAAARGVGVREFVDQGEGRLAGEQGVEVHLLDGGPPVVHATARNEGQILQQEFRLPPAVGFDQSDDQIGSFGPLDLGGLQHVVGLPDTGTHPEEDLEAPPVLLDLLGLEALQELIRIGPVFARGHRLQYRETEEEALRSPHQFMPGVLRRPHERENGPGGGDPPVSPLF